MRVEMHLHTAHRPHKQAKFRYTRSTYAPVQADFPLFHKDLEWSERGDLNSRPPVPQRAGHLISKDFFGLPVQRTVGLCNKICA